MDSGAIIALILLITPFILGFWIFKLKKTNKELEEKSILQIAKIDTLDKALSKYSDIINIDEYKIELSNENQALKEKIENLNTRKNLIEHDIIILDEELMLQSYGLYKPTFNFDDSEQYKDKLLLKRNMQKDMIKDKRAATCPTDWEVEGSKAKGRKLTNNNIKLALRAFNGDCEAAISKVTYNNIVAMQARIEKSYEMINKAMESNHITINRIYLTLKLDELKLTYELKEKQYEEKEEQKRIREEMREEQKAQKELEKAQSKAEQEEEKYQEALEKARYEVAQVTGTKHDKMMEQIQKLEVQLLEAQKNKQRAISRAQMTKSGHVYVISNIGSFGEDVYKIGMTRRLEPLDRVRELGDASVPFLFDVHALIFSDDAPKLEKELHRKFSNKRVNMVNERKEFFNVSLDEIKIVVEDHHGKIEFTKLAEAQEYRETLVIKSTLV